VRRARRALEVLRAEGPAGVLLRARRAVWSDQRRVFADYRRWLAAPEPPPPPGPTHGPRVSVLTPVCDPPPGVLRELLASVRAQSYPRWQLCLADDASRDPAVRRVLEEAARDPRVALVRSAERRGIAATTNAALGLAAGELVALLDHDDLLHPAALARCAAVFARDPEVDVLYTDEDKVDVAGRRGTPFFKPAFDPVLLLGCNYVAHLLVARRALVEEVGGLRPACDGSQDYDLVLRLAERARRIAHLPQVLYHWRIVPGSVAESPGAKPYALEAAERALGDALARRGVPGRVAPGPWTSSYRLEVPVDPASVSVVAAEATPPRWTRGLPVREVLGGGAAAGAGGRWLLLVARGVRPVGDPAAAVRALLRPAALPDVGLVGPKLVDPWGRAVEHGLDVAGGRLALAEGRLRAADPGYFGLARLPRVAPALSGRALLVERALLEALGGAGVPGPDLVRRARARGRLAVATPDAVFRLPPGSRGRRPGLAAAPGEPDTLNPNLRAGRTGLRLRPDPWPTAPPRVHGRSGRGPRPGR